MKMAKPITAEHFRLQNNFEAVRQMLLDERFSDRLDKPLAFWVLPSDRRLPIAFLGRSVRDILSTPYEQLCSTPGIGYKKIDSLVKLLHRATLNEPPGAAALMEPAPTGEIAEPAAEATAPGGFDPAVVSEALWQQWREGVRQYRLGHEKLGRLAPSLQSLPTVIWHTPLSFYTAYSLAEIRELKTHGEKRVRAVLEVFYEVNKMLSRLPADSSLSVRLVPKFVVAVESWIASAIASKELPAIEEIREHLVAPLLDQLYVDAGSMLRTLVEGRLGINGEPLSVQQQSRQLGVTRARIYQLFEECASIMNVRWPEGRPRMTALAAHLSERQAPPAVQRLVATLRDLLYPPRLLAQTTNGE